jgi:hypothetical protein
MEAWIEPEKDGSIHTFVKARSVDHFDLVTDYEYVSDNFPTNEAIKSEINAKPNELLAIFDANKAICELQVDDESFINILGSGLGNAFRARLSQMAKQAGKYGTCNFQMLDDIPTAITLASYAAFRRLTEAQGFLDETAKYGLIDRLKDTCSGWQQSGLAVRTIKDNKPIPVEARRLVNSTYFSPGLTSWLLQRDHVLRKRFLLYNRKAQKVLAGFRDTLGGSDNQEFLLHQYNLSMTISSDSQNVETLVATPVALPFPDCFSAKNSVNLLINADINGLESETVRLLNNVSGCLHLNDLLRSVGHALNYYLAKIRNKHL